MTASTDVPRDEICAVAVAECFRDAGEIFVSPMGMIPALGARIAKSTFAPDIVLTDGVSLIIANVIPLGKSDVKPVIEGAMPFRTVFDTLWSGKRHVMMGATQVDKFGNQNIACIGPFEKPKTQLLGVRGAPGNTINHPTSYWVGNHGPKVFVPKVDVVSGVGYDRVAALPEASRRFHHIHRVVSNLGVFDFESDDNAMRLRSVHPGVSVEDIVKNTGFELVIPRDVEVTRLPTEEERALIRLLDPNGLAKKEVAA
jgi:acyl CoA:acetate/3-ketoacid CoA transferase beta subunit